MSLRLPQDHPTFLLKNSIQEITKHFLKTNHFNYFQYLRCFADGSASILTNNTSIVEYFEQVSNSPVIFSSFTKQHINAHSYWFFWDKELPLQPVQFMREKFNLHSGLTLVRRNKHYYDMIAVALPKELDDAASFYLNKLKVIEQFIKEFDYNHKDLIKLMDKNPIWLPPPYRDVNHKKICLSEGKLAVIGKKNLTHITTQELAVLRLFIQHFTKKQIAQMLNISMRTVETYIVRVKSRTGFLTCTEMEHMMAHTGIIES